MKQSNYKNINKIDKLNRLNDKLENDKKACEDNIWFQLTENEITTLKYQLNQQKNEVKKLENQLKEQRQLIKQIQGLAKNYIEPRPVENKHIYSVDLISDSEYICKILSSINKLLFIDSTQEQWIHILDGKSPITEIETQKGVSLMDIRYFFDKLTEKEIIKKQYITNLVATKGIYYNGKPIRNRQLNDAFQRNQKTLPKLAKTIDSIFDLI